jgi:succinate dehydrogenase / fumarate reductase, cytochrome b subunit
MTHVQPCLLRWFVAARCNLMSESDATRVVATMFFCGATFAAKITHATHTVGIKTNNIVECCAPATNVGPACQIPGILHGRPMASRPKYLNLMQIRLPLPAVVSIMHRVSGAVLFLALPLLLCGLQQSLASAEGYATLRAAFSSWIVKVVATALVWGYLHHLCAGIRHLLLDLDIGTELAQARSSSTMVLVVSVALTLLAGVAIW